MKDIPSFIVGLGAGALLMYYLDQASGGRRRALVRDKVIGAGHDAAYWAGVKGRRAAGQVKGMVATRTLDGQTRREPESDAQLHDRIRARLGRVISHPKALHVTVDDGRITLSGRILLKELNELLSEVEGMTGVKEVRNELIAHETAEGIPELQGRTDPPGREQKDRGKLQREKG